MEQALAAARVAYGWTSPNPLVGAVVVQAGEVVGVGYHARAGQPHAEVCALQQAGERAHGATLYVTLEPCVHHGRTPPCTDAIIDARVQTVYYALPDPNPKVNGSGARQLQAAGINVQSGLLAAEAAELNRAYLYWMQQHLPYGIAKFAMSLDGKIATANGQSQWLTSANTRARAHILRQYCDAILIGSGTLVVDNPRLTNRWESQPVLERKQPLRVVVDSAGRIAGVDWQRLHLFADDHRQQTIWATTERSETALQQAVAATGAQCWVLPAAADGRVDLTALFARLAAVNVLAVLLEGGGVLLGAVMDAGLVQEVWAFIAPLLLGGAASPSPIAGAGVNALNRAWRLDALQVEPSPPDLLVRARVLPF